MEKLMKYDPKQNFSGEKILHHHYLKCNNLDNRELLNITLKARWFRNHKICTGTM